jgi:hypothetical protein
MADLALSKEEIYKNEEEVKKGASWFFWIAILSIINTIIVYLNGSLNFVIGLGITQIVDAFTIFYEPGGFNLDKTTGLSINLLITSIFFLFGYYAKQKKTWAFIVGMVLYALDGLVFLPVQDYWGFGFHVFALFMIFKGFQAIRVLNKIKVPLIDVNNLAVQSSNSKDSTMLSEEKLSELKCPSCGTELNASFKYCTSCGMRIPE